MSVAIEHPSDAPQVSILERVQSQLLDHQRRLDTLDQRTYADWFYVIDLRSELK